MTHDEISAVLRRGHEVDQRTSATANSIAAQVAVLLLSLGALVTSLVILLH